MKDSNSTNDEEGDILNISTKSVVAFVITTSTFLLLPYFFMSSWFIWVLIVLFCFGGQEEIKYGHSCRHWCLKEAFVKAMGCGIGYKLNAVEFHHMNWDNLFVNVAGKELKDWTFRLLQPGENHSVGPITFQTKLHIHLVWSLEQVISLDHILAAASSPTGQIWFY